MVFNQKRQKPIMLTANSSKNAKCYCQPTKESVCYNLPIDTHDEDHYHHPKNSKLASGLHTVWILNRDEKQNNFYQEKAKKVLKRQNIVAAVNLHKKNSQFTAATSLKIGTCVLISNFMTEKNISKKLQPNRKGPFQIIDKPTDVTYQLINSNLKK